MKYLCCSNVVFFVLFCRLAIKRVEDVFGTTTDAKRALREISIMRLCRHPNVVLLKNVYALPDDDTFKHLWSVEFNFQAAHYYSSAFV